MINIFWLLLSIKNRCCAKYLFINLINLVKWCRHLKWWAHRSKDLLKWTWSMGLISPHLLPHFSFFCFISLRFVRVFILFYFIFCTIEKTHWPIDQEKIWRMSPSNAILMSFSIKPETQDSPHHRHCWAWTWLLLDNLMNPSSGTDKEHC